MRKVQDSVRSPVCSALVFDICSGSGAGTSGSHNRGGFHLLHGNTEYMESSKPRRVVWMAKRRRDEDEGHYIKLKELPRETK